MNYIKVNANLNRLCDELVPAARANQDTYYDLIEAGKAALATIQPESRDEAIIGIEVTDTELLDIKAYNSIEQLAELQHTSAKLFRINSGSQLVEASKTDTLMSLLRAELAVKDSKIAKLESRIVELNALIPKRTSSGGTGAIRVKAKDLAIAECLKAYDADITGAIVAHNREHYGKFVTVESAKDSAGKITGYTVKRNEVPYARHAAETVPAPVTSEEIPAETVDLPNRPSGYDATNKTVTASGKKAK